MFGEAGRAARSAVGMAELPFDIAVEIEAVVQCTTEPESQAQLRDRVRRELAGEDLVSELLVERRRAADQEDKL